MSTPWQIGPFTKLDESNPVLGPSAESKWTCPLAGSIAWEEKDVFNPAAVARDGAIHLLYRSEDTVGKHLGTSRIGLAVSDDGLAFRREAEPVLFPANDALRGYEWEGGCEDPRVCGTEDGGYLMTYTAYDGVKARLCVATSSDLRTWTKHGLAFPEMPDLWSKSGAIVCRVDGERLVATQLRGQYWMYWGESYIFAATSDDLIHWRPVVHPTQAARSDQAGMPSAPDIAARWSPAEVGVTASDREALVAVIRPRTGRFDSVLVEPGPPAVITEHGIVLMYHGKNDGSTYSVGQLLLDPLDPTAVLARTAEPFLFPERQYEVTGQVGNVCFAEGLVPFGDRWLLYYGTADSKIAVASAPRLS
ncbi:glycoside hydrolase family 130 protein [Fimbriimonas ginsengisoli]|uniref:Glycosidase related protein n=1 Tax=Fimbriimonas ginsengisoli Gsoil 348 TaxID=661478 RepID=A0A068NZ46_FIMGI|nr:glycoside hydrolase family 130 protein [Fimbriimonas ginsengisoli]AIE87939.1 glycosidase related protein [Fimbriimonas ginsengisoli Gsoil 348]